MSAMKKHSAKKAKKTRAGGSGGGELTASSVSSSSSSSSSSPSSSSSSASSAASSSAPSSSSMGDGLYTNKQRVLVFSSRGPTAQFRHLLDDVRNMLPHHKKEVKLDARENLQCINEICEIKSCNSSLFFEYRKHKDLFLWVSKTPQGPSAKFHVFNVHTIDEMKLTGNCLKGSRAVLSFDAAFDDTPHLKLLKEMFTQIFGTPMGHPKSKPFVDHVIAFHWYDGAIFFRHYQVLNQNEQQFTRDDDIDKLILIEIGPRFSLVPIKAFEGSMGGETLWQNAAYIAPSKRRSRRYADFHSKREEKAARKGRHEKIITEGRDPDSYLRSV